VAEHIWIIGESIVDPIYELDGGEDVAALAWKKLEDRAMLATDNHTTVNKGYGRRGILAADRCEPERSAAVAKTPKAQGRVTGNCGDGGVCDIKLEGNERLQDWLSYDTQNKIE
jgi:hypothetical protein